MKVERSGDRRQRSSVPQLNAAQRGQTAMTVAAMIMRWAATHLRCRTRHQRSSRWRSRREDDGFGASGKLDANATGCATTPYTAAKMNAWAARSSSTSLSSGLGVLCTDPDPSVPYADRRGRHNPYATLTDARRALCPDPQPPQPDQDRGEPGEPPSAAAGA